MTEEDGKNQMHGKGVLIFGLLFGTISAFGVYSQSHNQCINWDEVVRIGKVYFGNPTPANARRLYLALPDSEVPQAERGDLFSKATDYLYTHLYDLKSHMPADRNAAKIAFRLRNISDGGFTEELDNVIGDLVDTNPRLFLEEIINGPIEIGVVCCGTAINKHYAEGSMKERNDELAKRIKRLESVKDKNLIPLRDNCIGQIKKCIAEDRTL